MRWPPVKAPGLISARLVRRLAGDTPHAGHLRLEHLGVAGERSGRCRPSSRTRRVARRAPPASPRPWRGSRRGLSGLLNWSVQNGVGLGGQPAGRARQVWIEAGRDLAADARHDLELGAEGAHRLQLLFREGVRRDEVRAVAERRADHRQRAAGAAAGVVDDAAAGLQLPARSAPAIIDSAMRSFMLPVGLAPSHLTQISTPLAGATRSSRMRGVLPMCIGRF